VSVREIQLDNLIGRTVFDPDGRAIGRIRDLRVEIVLRDHFNDYVVAAYLVGLSGLLERLTGSRFAWQALKIMGHRSLTIPWDVMDLSDPLHPRLTRRVEELSQN
jgi:hypothetical protein